jgi:uncharacterized protein YndB with AHSA1/START domain
MDETTNSTDFVYTRTFDAPRDLVWKAWSEPDRLARWWGPKGFTMRTYSLDFRPGGHFHYLMTTGGNEMWGKFFYREIEEPGKIVWVNCFSDAEGNITRAPFSDLCPLEMLNIMTLTEDNGKTILSLRGRPINASEAEVAWYQSIHDGMTAGFGATFDQLDAYLDEADREFVISRVFDAPRELVWKAWTEPEHLIQWWGPKGFTNTFHERDFRPGGVWRFMMHGPDGTDYPNKVIFTEIVPRERIASDHGDDGENFPMFQACTTFMDLGGKTRVTHRLLLPTAEARHAAASYAIEGGNQTMERLAEHLKTMAA